ncbi:MAG: pitrilysin family protein [Bdellovibrionota bacterium]
MKKLNIKMLLGCLFSFLFFSISCFGLDLNQIQLPYQTFVLDNGLTVVVHEDHKAPVVAVSVWYHVGSKDEKVGKTGFAHLFEHLMFQGSEHFNEDYFNGLEKIGATDVNGTTSLDQTNYYQTVPTNALDTALFLESDRMGHFLKAISQARLDEQLKVVKNEKRQSHQVPYGIASEIILKSSFPDGHPYQWLPIGSMEDLDRATLEDVKEWFSSHYGPSNAVLVIAGDVSPSVALSKAKLYFESIQPGPPLARLDQWVAKRTQSSRVIAQDRVPLPRIHLVWNVPGLRDSELTDLEIVADVLGGGQTSRLYQSLVVDQSLASDVSAGLLSLEIASLFIVDATAKPGVPLEKVEEALRKEINKALKKKFTTSEIELSKSRTLNAQIRLLEKVGGAHGKAQILAYYQTYYGDPSAFKKELETIQRVSAKKAHKSFVKWISNGDLALEIQPFPTYKADAHKLDRSTLPLPTDMPKATFPDIERSRLSNGLEIVLARRENSPLMSVDLVIKGGFSADPKGKEGLGRLTIDLLNEASKSKDLKQLNIHMEKIGADIGTSINTDEFVVSMSNLKANAEKSFLLFSEIVLSPKMNPKDFLRIQQEQLEDLLKGEAKQTTVASRITPTLLFPKDHPYGAPAGGIGYESSVKSITQKDCVEEYHRFFSPQNARLFVVGDLAMEELVALAQKSFGSWKGSQVERSSIATLPIQKHKPIFYLSHVEGASQTAINVARLLDPIGAKERSTILMANDIIAGARFTNRINMNLREDKGWTYGASASIDNLEHQARFVLRTQVQKDKTAQSIVELMKEFRGVSKKTRPIKDGEFEKNRNNYAMKLGGNWETNDSILSHMRNVIESGYPENYYQGYANEIMSMKRKEVEEEAQQLFDENTMIFVVVGDLPSFENSVRSLKLGTVVIVDHQGHPLP